ncbi:MAG TPA: hypothetical protein PK323_06905 [Bacteroidia bacterium]|nr:hypothetical protein [Bacteroidia bacterium]
MKLKFISLVFINFALIAISYGQAPEIGQDASLIKEMVEYRVKSYYNAQGPHTVKTTYDTKYNNGKIEDVIYCEKNRYMTDFKITVSYCEHYIMESEKLTYIIKQYDEISIEKLTELFNTVYGNSKIDKYYFVDNFEHYQTLYLSTNGLASVEWGKTETLELPKDLKDKIEQKKLEQKQKNIANAKANESKDEIVNKTYEVEANKLQDFITVFSKQLLNYFEKEVVPTDDKSFEYGEYKNGYYFNGVYNIYAGQEKEGFRDNSKFYPFLIFEDISGTQLPMMSSYINSHKVAPIKTSISDTRFYTLKNITGIGTSINDNIPSHYVESYKVSYFTVFNQMPVFIAKGILKIKVKNEIVSFPDNESLQNDVKELIQKEIKNLKLENGKYKIKYYVHNVCNVQQPNKIDILK